MFYIYVFLRNCRFEFSSPSVFQTAKAIHELWDRNPAYMGDSFYDIDELTEQLFEMKKGNRRAIHNNLWAIDYESEESESLVSEELKIYPFTEGGIKMFTDNASNDFFEAFGESGDLSAFDIVISVGNHRISVPLGAEEWDSLEGFLCECLDINQ